MGVRLGGLLPAAVLPLLLTVVQKKQMFMSTPRGSTLQEHLFFTFDFITANTDCIEKLQDRIKAAEYRVLSLAPVSLLQRFICVSLKQF